jgi:hypothetical protein
MGWLEEIVDPLTEEAIQRLWEGFVVRYMPHYAAKLFEVA